MISKKIPPQYEAIYKSLKPRFDLARIGGYRDGGYVLPYKVILNAKNLISGGVGSNARFEADCLDINPLLDITLIDKSYSPIRVILRLIYHFFQKREKGLISLVEAASTFRVLKNSKLIKKFLDDSFSLNQIFNNTKVIESIVKLDIEGSEYSQLSSILEHEKSIIGLCIEFHDLDQHHNLLKLKKFIEETSFELIFVSINEASFENGVPSCLELSFSRKESVQAIDNSYLQASTFPGELTCCYYG